MILEHAPFGHRGLYSSFTLQGVQAGQILAAAVFLPLAAYMPRGVHGMGVARRFFQCSRSRPATSFVAVSRRRQCSLSGAGHREAPAVRLFGTVAWTCCAWRACR
jgi:hypothetical protein